MQLFEALKTIRDRNADRQAADGVRTFDLLCGFTPLHLQTFLTAALLQRIDDSSVEVEIGLFGDLLGNIERASSHSESALSHGVAIVIEWSDIDPRLGLRSTHGWRPDRANDILASATNRLEQLAARISKLAEQTCVAVSLPSLPLPPMFLAPTTICTAFNSRLRARVHDFAARLADSDVRILNAQALDVASPPAERFDVASEIRTGFPYQMQHAWLMAKHFADVLRPQTTLKGIITDLDNTLWAGIVGEDGIDAVSWDLDKKTQHHGLYQEQLASLAASGTLLAIASKNDARVAGQALARDDMVITQDQFFPIEANWGAKSASIARILAAWNISADSVVFIDDSPIEIAEVSAAFPQMQCRLFPSNDPAAVLDLLNELRDRFGRFSVSDEDKLRSQSLRASSELKQSNADPETFLASAEAQLKLAWNQPDARSLELINKTNQFNLNGRRIDDADWHRRLSDPSHFLLTVSYTDKFAPLGKIAVALGQVDADAVVLSAWVMSCRAFSRRIEHGTLQAIFERFDCSEIRLCFEPTERNAPLQSTLDDLACAQIKQPECAATITISRADFEEHCPLTYFEVSTDDSQLHSIPA
jgi:FkbH-like protein